MAIIKTYVTTYDSGQLDILLKGFKMFQAVIEKVLINGNRESGCVLK